MVARNLFKGLSIAAIGVCATLGTAGAAQAFTIDTSSSWNGSHFIAPFGESNTATYGQTFTVGTDNVLNDFSFWLGGLNSSDAIDFAAYLMEWDGAKAVGNILYQSAMQSKAATAAFQQFTFNTGGVSLTSGKQYVAFLSASNFFDGENGTTGMGWMANDVYAGGSFVSFNNGGNFNLLTSSAWDSLQIVGPATDAAFTASFSATPVPTPALLPGLIGLGVGVLRKRKGEAEAETEA